MYPDADSDRDSDTDSDADSDADSETLFPTARVVPMHAPHGAGDRDAPTRIRIQIRTRMPTRISRRPGRCGALKCAARHQRLLTH